MVLELGESNLGVIIRYIVRVTQLPGSLDADLSCIVTVIFGSGVHKRKLVHSSFSRGCAYDIGILCWILRLLHKIRLHVSVHQFILLRYNVSYNTSTCWSATFKQLMMTLMMWLSL